MLEHTKTLHTKVASCVESDIFRVVCPLPRAAKIKHFLLEQGCTLEELVDPSVVFPHRSPATLLRGARHREGLTQQQLATLCAISRHHISEMESGNRTIDKHNAHKLGEVLHVDARMFF